MVRRLLLFAIVAAEAGHAVVAIAGRRLPAGHDGFQYFTLQYYFLDNAIQTHDVAQWVPYLTHGTVATLWYTIQASFLQSVLLQVAPIVRGVDLLTIFHLNILVDQLILLAGTWLVGRRFFRTPALVFVTATVVGSAVWLDQPYWNVRLYYALPLVIEMGHRFLERGAWRWAAAGANLLALQTIGNLPYVIPVQSFAVFAYFAAYVAVNGRETWPRLRAIRWGWPAIGALAVAALSFGAAYGVLGIGTGSLVSYNAGRRLDGTTDLAGFLTYGGATDLGKWADVVLGLSPWLDLTLYAGIFFAPMVVAGLLGVDRRRLHFVVLGAVLLLFTLGTPVSAALYWTWPGMRYFRHIGLVSPLVKVIAAFVAGIGFEYLFDTAGARRRRILAATAGAALLVAGGVLALVVAGAGPAMGAELDRVWGPPDDRPVHPFVAATVARRLRTSATIALGGAAVVLIVPIWLSGPGGARSRRARRAVVGAVLVLAAADVYRFRFACLVDDSEPVRSASTFVTRAGPLPYDARREPGLVRATIESPRLQAIAAFHTALRRQVEGASATGTQYWTNAMFYFTDEAGASFRVDSWLRPLDELMRMFWGDPIENVAIPPRGIGFEHLDFPMGAPGAAAVAGVTADKIRFFARAFDADADAALVPLMTDPSYTGAVLFVRPGAAPTGGGPVAGAIPWTAGTPLSADDTRAMPYDVRRFDANHLVVHVANAGGAAAWMTYADVWHPFWRAAVNGRPVPVARADLAYKAVPLVPGDNIVEFEFGSTGLAWLVRAFALNAACWLAALAWLAGRAVRRA